MENKEKIRIASIKVISQKGFHKTRIQDIAEKSDLAVGTIYNYFAKKDDILFYIFDYETKKRLELISFLEAKNISVKEIIYKFISFNFLNFYKNPDLSRVLLNEKDFYDEKSKNSINTYLRTITQNIERIIIKGIDNGEIKNVDPHLLAIYFIVSIQWIIEYALTQQDMAAFNKTTDFILERIDEIFID